MTLVRLSGIVQIARRDVVVLAITLFSVIVWTACSSSHTEDRNLIALFQSKRIEFIQLVNFVRRHRELRFISPDTLVTNSEIIHLIPGKQNYTQWLSEADWKRYLNLKRQLHLHAGIRSTEQPASIYFPADAASLSNGASEKGFVYSEVPLAPLKKELDDLRGTQVKLAYRALYPNWYLYLAFD